MEFEMKNFAGILEKYFIDPRTGSAHKVSENKHEITTSVIKNRNANLRNRKVTTKRKERRFFISAKNTKIDKKKPPSMMKSKSED